MAEERELRVDVEGFNIAMNEVRERSRNAQHKQAAVAIVMNVDATSVLHKRGIATTNDSFKFTWFENHKSVIKSIYTGSEYVEHVVAGNDVGIILESTIFMPSKVVSLRTPTNPRATTNGMIHYSMQPLELLS